MTCSHAIQRRSFDHERGDGTTAEGYTCQLCGETFVTVTMSLHEYLANNPAGTFVAASGAAHGGSRADEVMNPRFLRGVGL